MSGQIDGRADEYSDKLIKLLPAEGIAALLAINRLVPDDSDYNGWMIAATAIVAAFVVLWAYRMRHITAKLQLAFLLVAFLIWSFNILWDRIQPSVPGLSVEDGWLPAGIAILFTLFIPFVFPTAPEKA